MANDIIKENVIIEKAIEEYYKEETKENMIEILESIRSLMNEDGQFILPVVVHGEGTEQFEIRSVNSNDGKQWCVAFTSEEEYKKGIGSDTISHFIDSALKFALESGVDGIVINPWGQSFLLSRELIEMIYKANEELMVSDDKVTKENLADGTALKQAIEVCQRNRTELNLMKLSVILRDSVLYIPCEDSTGTNPDILKNGAYYFLPVFTSEEETGEYGKRFSNVQISFSNAVKLAKNSKKKLSGMVINAFTDSFIVPKEMFDVIANMND